MPRPKRGRGRLTRSRKPRTLRRRQAGYWERKQRLTVSLRESDLIDIERIAAEWGVPASTVGWTLIHSKLRGIRRAEPYYGPMGIGVCAALLVRILPGPLGVAIREALEAGEAGESEGESGSE